MREKQKLCRQNLNTAARILKLQAQSRVMLKILRLVYQDSWHHGTWS